MVAPTKESGEKDTLPQSKAKEPSPDIVISASFSKVALPFTRSTPFTMRSELSPTTKDDTFTTTSIYIFIR